MGWDVHVHDFVQYAATCGEQGCEWPGYVGNQPDAERARDQHYAWHSRLYAAELAAQEAGTWKPDGSWLTDEIRQQIGSWSS